MDSSLKQRLVGAVVLVALGVIFLPMLVKGPAPDSGVADVPLTVPAPPRSAGTETVELPLDVPAASPAGGVTGMPAPAAPDTAAAAPAASASAAPPAAGAQAAAGDYVVEFGRYASAGDADKVIAALRGAGLAAYREATTVAGKPAQQVRIGPFADRAAAESARLTATGLDPRVSAKVIVLDAGNGPAAPAAQAPAATPPPAATPASAAAATAMPAVPAPKPESKPAAAPAAKPAEAAAAAAKPAQPAPAAPPAKPAQAPANAAGTGFVVQVGAFADAAAATALRDRLRAAGFNAFTDRVQTEGGARTRVRVGPAVTRAEADALKAQVKAKAGLDGIVRPHP